MSALIPSSRDKVAFSQQIEIHFKKLADEHLAIRRRKLPVPVSIMRAIEDYLPMHHRFAAGVFRHSQKEVHQEAVVARWIIEQWHELKGTQPPAGTKMEWNF